MYIDECEYDALKENNRKLNELVKRVVAFVRYYERDYPLFANKLHRHVEHFRRLTNNDS